MDAEELMGLLPRQRRKVRLRRKPRGSYRRKQEKKRTPDELLAFLRTHDDLRSARAVRAYRERDRSAPNLHDFCDAFGSWQKSKELAFGLPPPDPCSVQRPSPNYLVSCVLDMGLWTTAAWLKARRLNPELVPSIYWARRLWGCFDNLKWQAERESFAKNFEALITLRHKLKRVPSHEECDAAAISLAAIRRVFSDKRDFYRTLDYLPEDTAFALLKNKV